MSSHDPPSAACPPYGLRIANARYILSAGATGIGRDDTSRITICSKDVSRHHARISCSRSSVVIEDLDSRNGTRLNGVLLTGPHSLRSGDRIGIAHYELIVVPNPSEADGAPDVLSGIIQLCAGCQRAHRADDSGCPYCGTSLEFKRPPSGEVSLETHSRWSTGMLIEVIGKAILANRVLQVERMMHELAILLRAASDQGLSIDPSEMRAIQEAVSWLAKEQNSTAWSTWFADLRSAGAAVGSERH